MREHFQQVVEDLHEVRSIQRGENGAEKSQNQEQPHIIQELVDVLNHVEIHVGTMAFESRVQNEVANKNIVDGN